MDSDTLSQAEVESLLTALETSAPTGPAKNAVASRHRDKVTAYDFKRPERVGKEQMRALQTLHEGFGRNFGVVLSGLLRSMVEVKLTSVDQLTYSEFVFSLENPTCFNLLRADPLEGNLILDINPGVLFPIIDRLLGGGRESTTVTRRPLTEIELRLVSRITDLFLAELKRAWENVATLDAAVVRVESNPQLVQIVPPNEVVVLISFELTLGEQRGMMNLCIPFNSLERISGKLSANNWITYSRREASTEAKKFLQKNVRHANVEIVAQLAETTITAKELLALRVNDIITTRKDIHSPMVIVVQGSPKFHANPGVYKGHKALLIDSPISEKKPPG